MGKEAEMRKMRDSRIKKENEGWGVVRTSKKSSSLAHILTVLWESRHRCVGTQNNNDDHNDNGGNSFEIIMMIMKAMIILIFLSSLANIQTVLRQKCVGNNNDDDNNKDSISYEKKMMIMMVLIKLIL